MAYFVQSDSGRMRSDPRCAMLAGTCRSMVSSDREEGRLPNVPSEPTMTSDLPLSLGHLPLGTMVPHFPKQLRQLVINSRDVQQLPVHKTHRYWFSSRHGRL